ncbi:MAG TPA: tetratricopeptide repeat protein [Bryobacteraceae bacterium]|jgi:tetratricopeptide (TPR) repeat protein|nr:tetratricopeptide repeat protein [Bryobacteraceae bacterium]
MLYLSGSRLFYGCVLLAFGTVGGFGQQTGSSTVSGLVASSTSRKLSAPDFPPISNETRGDIYMARKMYLDAIDMYRLGPANSAVLANKIGIAFHQMLQLQLAKKNYERAIKLDPKYPEALNNLGTIYYAHKSYRRAISYYKRALRVGQPSASIYSNLGSAYFVRRDYKQATAYYEKALQLDPLVFEHHSNFGTLMQERTVDERAKFHLYLAKMYAQSGDKTHALIYLRKALEEGVKDRQKIPEMPEFATLKTDPAFKDLMIENPKPL